MIRSEEEYQQQPCPHLLHLAQEVVTLGMYLENDDDSAGDWWTCTKCNKGYQMKDIVEELRKRIG